MNETWLDCYTSLPGGCVELSKQVIAPQTCGANRLSPNPRNAIETQAIATNAQHMRHNIYTVVQLITKACLSPRCWASHRGLEFLPTPTFSQDHHRVVSLRVPLSKSRKYKLPREPHKASKSNKHHQWLGFRQVLKWEGAFSSLLKSLSRPITTRNH
jgi:hypothetical protein